MRAAQDGKSKITVMREMWYRKRNVGTHALRAPGVREGEKNNTWQAPDGTGPDKRSVAEWHREPE